MLPSRSPSHSHTASCDVDTLSLGKQLRKGTQVAKNLGKKKEKGEKRRGKKQKEGKVLVFSWISFPTC